MIGRGMCYREAFTGPEDRARPIPWWILPSYIDAFGYWRMVSG